jgi:hypothetical protein
MSKIRGFGYVRRTKRDMRDMRDMRDICHGCHGHDNPVRGRDIIGCSLREPQCHALDVTLWWFEYTAVFSRILGFTLYLQNEA